MSSSFILRAVMAVAVAAFPAAQLGAQGSAPDNGTIVVKGLKPEKKVCKVFDAPTGSRLGERRVCMTKGEWKLAEDSTQRKMDRENLRTQADQAQTLNERGGLARKLPH